MPASGTGSPPKPMPASNGSPARSIAPFRRSIRTFHRVVGAGPSRAPDFWWRRRGVAGYALAPLGMLYGRVAGRRMEQLGASVGVPIVCIGNLVLGGAGKTPTAIEVAEVCSRLGLAPAFLTRGY